MNEMVIKRHSFDLAKKRLKDFSERAEAELEIDKVETDGGFLGFVKQKQNPLKIHEPYRSSLKNLILLSG